MPLELQILGIVEESGYGRIILKYMVKECGGSTLVRFICQ